jgi:DNA-binding MarR family transcriptional regulator
MKPEPRAKRPSVDTLFQLVPPIFFRLTALGDRLHADRGITAAMRGVLASLAGGGPQTVPQMARARPVSRQHIQTLVDALAERELVAFQPNPAHRRSPVVALTERGRTLFADMRAREAGIVERLDHRLSADKLAASIATLQTLAAQLANLLAETEAARHTSDPPA